jgi:hypothetical protein
MSKQLDIAGKRFGFWMAVKQDANNKNGHTQWLCRCDCGTKRLVTLNSLTTGNSTSCGCNHNPDLIGKKFGKLVVIDLSDKNRSRKYWVCQCKCGETITASTYQLREKHITSCGCNKKKRPTSIANNKKFADLTKYRVEFMKKLDQTKLAHKQDGIIILADIDETLRKLTPRT